MATAGEGSWRGNIENCEDVEGDDKDMVPSQLLYVPVLFNVEIIVTIGSCALTVTVYR
jgi:hypothetical protein